MKATLMYSCATILVTALSWGQGAKDGNSAPTAPAPIQVEDRIDPLGTVQYWYRVPTGNNAEMTLNGTSYEKNLLVYVGRFGFYVDGGGFEPSSDGYGRIKEKTRVLVNEKTRFGFEVGKDGRPKRYLLNDKAADCLVGLGRYRYLAAGVTNAWYDIQKGEEVLPESATLEVVRFMDNSGTQRSVSLAELIAKYQQALDGLYQNAAEYGKQIGKHSNKNDRLAAAVAFHRKSRTRESTVP